jgi:DNA-binding NarL/FixJ family response regulator
MPVRCLIVDDNERFLAAARGLLEREGVTVVGTALSGSEAVRLRRELRPDVTLLDVDLGGESGFDVARRLVDDDPATAASIILISSHAEADFKDLIDASPVAGFVSKAELSSDTIRASLAAARRPEERRSG